MNDYDYDRATPELRLWFEETLRVLAGRLDDAPRKRVQSEAESKGAAAPAAESSCRQSPMF